MVLTSAAWLLGGLSSSFAALAQTAAPSVTTSNTPGKVSSVAPAAAAAAVTTSSGLIYRSLKAGTGASPKSSDVVKVHYRGTLPQGAEFDSSYSRGSPAEFPLNRVIPCWTEGVQMMKIGGKAHLTCPPEIAYGARGTPGGPIPPNATLHFEVELLGIQSK